jgi:hypothetical protein
MRPGLLGLVILTGVASACSSPTTTFENAGAGGATTTTASGGMSGSGAGSGVGGMGGRGVGGAGGSGMACQWSADSNPCGDGFYCNATDCVSGTCEAIVKTDDVAQAPVCGCDGVNYWNANTAAAYGMAVEANGECSQPTTCAPSDATPCPSTRQFCAQLVSNQAACVVDPSLASGVCWGMPEMCPPTVSTPWRPCNSTLPNEPCVGECEAIKAKRKHFQDNTCPT